MGEKSNQENRENEPQPENLTPEQIEALKNTEIEVLEEHPHMLYCEYKGDFTLTNIEFLMSRSGISKEAIKKPTVFVKRKKEQKIEIPPLNEAIDKLTSENEYKKMLEKYPNIRFSRSWVTDLRMSREKEHYLERDDGGILSHHLIGDYAFTCDRVVRHFPGYNITIMNMPEDFHKRVMSYVQLEELYHGLSIESDERGVEFEDITCLEDANALEKKWKEKNYQPLTNRTVDSGETDGYEGLRQKLVDYRENFFPEKFQEMAQLQDEINTWLRSLKVEE